MEKLRKPTNNRPPRRLPRSHGSLALAGEFAPAEEQAPETNVRVIFGASVQDMPLAGVTVARARELAGTILEVHPRSPVLVNGRPGRSNHVIAIGDTLEFVHHAGEKGAGRGHSR